MTLDEFLHRYPVRMPDGRDGCWLWAGAKSNSKNARRAYGQMSLGGRVKYVHRVTYELAHGPIPSWAVLVRRVDVCESACCCNPDHWIRKRRADVPRIASKHGLLRSGPAHSAAVRAWAIKHPRKLTLEQARAIRASTEPATVAAERYGVSRWTVWAIRRGRNWREATPFSGLVA